jgi:hypothetical protein
MCEDVQTAIRHDIVEHEDQQRRFTSFYISDILGDRSNGRPHDLILEESSVFEVDSTQERTIELSTKGTIFPSVRLVFFRRNVRVKAVKCSINKQCR